MAIKPLAQSPLIYTTKAILGYSLVYTTFMPFDGMNTPRLAELKRFTSRYFTGGTSKDTSALIRIAANASYSLKHFLPFSSATATDNRTRLNKPVNQTINAILANLSR